MKFALHVGCWFGNHTFLSKYIGVAPSAPIIINAVGFVTTRRNKPVCSDCPEGTNQFARNNPKEQTRFDSFLRTHPKEHASFYPKEKLSFLGPKDPTVCSDQTEGTNRLSRGLFRDIFNLANGGDGIIFFQTFSSYNFGSATQVGVGRGSGGFAQSGPGETPSCARRPREAVTRRRLFGGGPCIDCGDVSTRGT